MAERHPTRHGAETSRLHLPAGIGGNLQGMELPASADRGSDAVIDRHIQTTSAMFRFRGPRSFYFARKRYKLVSLRVRMAEHRTCHPGGGGGFDGQTGDGEAWHKTGDRFGNGWFFVRQIKAGQWHGLWTRKRAIGV